MRLTMNRVGSINAADWIRRAGLALGSILAMGMFAGWTLAADAAKSAEADTDAAAATASESAVPGASKEIKSITDAAGNPINMGPHLAGTQRRSHANPIMTSEQPLIQRGQSWWPYGEAVASYAPADRSVESLTEDEIQVNGVALINVREPERSLEALPKDLLVEAGSQLRQVDGFYLVKIRGVSRTQAEVDALESAGAVLGEFLNINTYIAKIPGGNLAAVRALPFVTYVGDYQPAFKISPRIGLEQIPQSEVYDSITGQPKPWVFEINLHKGAVLDDVVNGLAQIGIVVQPSDVVVGEGMTTILVATVPDSVVSIAQVPGVKWIAEKTYPRLWASSVSPATVPMVLQNNGTFTTSTATGWKLWNAGIDGNASGTAQVVTVMDTGLNTSAYHFSQDTVNAGTLSGSHRKVVAYDLYGGGDLCVNNFSTADGGHGTWTSQHAVGSISNMTSNPDTTHTPNGNYDVGIARDAKVYFQDIGNSGGSISPPLDLGPSITAAIGKGSFIQNHSWGTASPTYDTEASNLDTALFSNSGFVVTVAAGNNGTVGTGSIGSPCTSKNVICVGGNDVASPNALFEDCLWDGVGGCGGVDDLGSARGPVATSGRVKPDICTYVAFSATVGGENEAGNRPHAMCQTDGTKTPYWDFVNSNGFGGTSFSAPEVAGLAALVRDYFQAGFYPTGTATPANTLTPSGSLVKAMILASGEDMTGSSPSAVSPAITKRYSSDVGYGRANLPSVFHVTSSAPNLYVQNSDNLGDGATKSFSYTINGNSMPLRVMLVWYDAAGNAIQKDADLKVTIGANTYWGNNFSAGWSTSSTSTRDHTNTSEGVLLDAAHGLPASGSFTVDVIGFSNPGGMNYSLVVTGDVVSTLVTQVSLNKGTYTCKETVQVTVNDPTATSPVTVVLTSRNAATTVIGLQNVVCTGSGGVFTGSIQTGTGITVADGGTITTSYSGASPVVANIACQLSATDGGNLIGGGCDNAAAGTDAISGPLTNGGSNEFYNKYMDAGENSSYTFGFTNTTGIPLTDATVTVSFSGAAASKMTVYNNPVHIGAIGSGALAGAVFQLKTDATAVGLSSVNLDFDITSPNDGYTTPRRLTQVQLLQANDITTRQAQCATFNTALGTFSESAVTGGVVNPWRWSGAATTPATIGSENRTDGSCSNSTANAGAMVGNSGTTLASQNFASNADSVLLTNFQPTLRGNGPSGQPYHYVWKWHSFYHASELLANQGGVWGAFYNDGWNSAVNPTGDQVTGFPIAVAYYYHTVFDYVGTWNWETANTGTPDDPHFGPTSGGAPNQLIITFNGVDGLATAGTYFSYGHEHADVYFFNGGTSHGTHRDLALDNDRLVYDEYYTDAQAGASCSGAQLGQVAFDSFTYSQCPTGTATLSVVDANASGPLTVTVTSPGTGDSETVTLTGSAPYFSGTITLSTTTGRGNNNGTLFVLPTEVINASYTDASPAGSTTASANTGCTGGNVVYVSTAQISDNGDNDGIPDNNETVTIDITIKNNLATPLTNTKVVIFPDTSTVDCANDPQALYGTVGAGATATNPPGDRFTFHVASAVACADWQAPPVVRFTVVITGDGLDGSSTLQTFNISLDLDTTGAGGSYNLSQTFTVDPGWLTTTTADDTGTCATPYVNNFHWCALCGNASGGYGAWVGNAAFGTSGQNYPNYDSSTLYSPEFVANGNVGLSFQVAYRTEATFDGAIVQAKVGAGAWTTVGFTTPAQSATTTSDFCSPLANGAVAWNGNGVSWTTTNAASVTASSGQTIQFRWRLGTDTTNGGTTYGGYGVDAVNFTNLKQTLVCEPTRNTGLGGCGGPCVGQPNGTGCDDGNACTQTDTCQSGSCVGSNPVTCSALDQCHDVGVCNPGTGLCSNPNKANGSSCSDGNACTLLDTCQSGTCTAGSPVTCSPLDQCHDAGVCNTGTGLCSNPNKANGSACNDANACTQTDTCQTGTCVGSNPVVCSALDQCHDAGVCNTGTGVCSNPNKANGSPCNDTNACTQTDTCQTGTCVGGNPVVCSPLDQCHNAGVCNTGTGNCSNPNKPDGSGCDDGALCTGSDVCTGGSCGGTAYTPPNEVPNQRFSSKVQQDWDAATGGGPGLVYDVVRGTAYPVGSAGEICKASGTGALFVSTGETPPVGTAFWYVVRARTSCTTGSYGNATGPVTRVTTSCP